MSSNIYGQSTKESYRTDIEDSRKQKTLYKNYEYFDDYSYGNSTKMGMWVKKNKDKYSVVFFQENGPQTVETLKKLLEWRRSGNSNEVGHKGGGNKRNIYGFEAEKVTIVSKIGDTEALICETKPNDLYNLSKSDIDELTFRNVADSSTYIKCPEIKDIDEDLPSWYKNYYNQITEECGLQPDYLIRMDMNQLPAEYIDKNLWNEFINQVRAKQYSIPIYFKNERLNMDKYENYDNIDLVGFNDDNKIKPLQLSLFINKETKEFYLTENDKFVNVKTCIVTDDTDNLIEWGKIDMFITNKDYLTEQFKEFNSYVSKDGKEYKLTMEHFYGVYLKINGKITNFQPIEGKPIVPSKANNIYPDSEKKNTTCFRLIITPNNDVCIDKEYFDALIKTETIKALSGFLDKSPYKEILRRSMDIYRGISIIKDKTKSSKKSTNIKIKKTKPGGVYMVYLGGDLFKYGCVDTYERINERITEHEKASKEMVKHFSNKTIKCDTCITIINNKTETPKADEEKIARILESHRSDKITLFESNGSGNKQREYFLCSDFNYIIDEIRSIFNNN